METSIHVTMLALAPRVLIEVSFRGDLGFGSESYGSPHRPYLYFELPAFYSSDTKNLKSYACPSVN